MNQQQRIDLLITSLGSRILLLDGATGTALQQKNLTAEDFGGNELEGCNENLVLTRPDVILDIHRQYLQSGADIIETNTFGATPVVLAEYELSHLASQINQEAARLARQAATEFSTPDKPRFVAGSIGPTTKAISVTGGITFTELIENFYVQAKALYEGGVDYFLLETCQDTRNIKAGILAIERLKQEVETPLPIAVSGTIEPMGTMLAGQNVEALITSLEHVPLLYLGLNCATGPEFMTDHIRTLAEQAPWPIACVPNAGLPDEDGRYLETPDVLAKHLEYFCQSGWINLLGGCCGTTSEHIAALAQVAKDQTPRAISISRGSQLSGIENLLIEDENRPILVGERTNVIGSRKFKRLICEGQFDEASDIARRQVKGGAQILDVCLANPDRDELQDMEAFLEQVIQKVKIPLMIDSTDEAVIERALTYSQGKAIINSINLEDGEERFEKVVPMARQFGAALIVGTIDEDPIQGMGVTRERKLAIAQRSYDLLTQKYHVRPEDIYFDPLVFPCATGDEQYIGSAVETIEGVRLIKEHFPQCKTALGISNVSFGLPPAGREVLNSVFLYLCVKAGLDLALVNTELLRRYSSLDDTEKTLSTDLLYNRGDDPVGAFANYFRERKVQDTTPKSELSLEERLAQYIIEGSKDGLTDDLAIALETYVPLDIINGPLMNGMDEVGRLFNDNELIVAEVLQSAEAMKAAVSYLEPHMDKAASSSKGKVLLATVKGDVHDIGKNLVDIILSNNAFEVINLGIKIPPEQLLQAIQEHQPDIVGLSGLLVKSAQQMVITAADLTKAGVKTPILVGGAALSRNFTDKKISPAYSGLVCYAKDAMDGLSLAKKIIDPKTREQLQQSKAAMEDDSQEQQESGTTPLISTTRSTKVSLLDELPPAPDFEPHTLKHTPIAELWNYMNPRMLLGKHLGVKGSLIHILETEGVAALPNDDASKKLQQILETLEEVKAEYGKSLFTCKARYQFFPAASSGNQLYLYDPKDPAKTLETFDFPRQQKPDGLCLSDYVTPMNSHDSKDSIALFITTVGQNIREQAEAWKNSGDYLKSHILQSLAIEAAEAYAEWLHRKIRGLWGVADSPTLTMKERFQAKYHGKRYSFGYPACPDLSDQQKLFRLLAPQDLGIELTEGDMMEPEASVSALVIHHPQASYFAV